MFMKNMPGHGEKLTTFGMLRTPMLCKQSYIRGQVSRVWDISKHNFFDVNVIILIMIFITFKIT